MLENFRKMRITLNRADHPIYKKLIAKEGDLGGRELEVQIINNNVLSSLENVELVLYWKNLSMGNQGDKYFEVVDRDKGIFKVSYPKSMLNKGNVTAHIGIFQGSSRVTNTLNFTIEVEGNGYNAQTAIASDDFQALNDALRKVNSYQNDFEDIKKDIIEAGSNLISSERVRIREILDEIEPRLDGLESQFDSIINDVTEEGEVLSSRTSRVTGKGYDTLGNRLDGLDDRTLFNDLDRKKRVELFLELENNQPRIRMEEIE